MNCQVKQTCFSECSSEVICIKISKDFTAKRRVKQMIRHVITGVSYYFDHLDVLEMRVFNKAFA